MKEEKLIDNLPLVTVIVPVYKVEEYLEKCIDSIRKQTYHNLEIILVDDGSPDNCGKICDNYAQIDDRIVVIHQENSGISAARNNALKIAKGIFIGFVDSDDWIDPETYSNAVAEMSDEVDLVCWGVTVESEDYSDKKVKGAQNYYKMKVEGLKVADNAVGCDTIETIWNKLFKKAIIDKYDIKYPVGRKFEDNVFFANYFVHCRSVFYMNKALYHHSMRIGSIMDETRELKNTNIFDMLYIFDAIYNHMQDYGLFNKWNGFLTYRYRQCLKNGYLWSPQNQKHLFLAKATEMAQAYDMNNFTTKSIEFVQKADYFNVPEINVYKEQAEKFQKEIYLLRYLRTKQEERTEIIQKRVYKERYEKNKLAEKLEQEQAKNNLLMKNIEEQDIENKKIKKALLAIKSSISFKIGRIITWLPRRIREILG